jgi:hypothetical protein
MSAVPDIYEVSLICEVFLMSAEVFPDTCEVFLISVRLS